MQWQSAQEIRAEDAPPAMEDVEVGSEAGGEEEDDPDYIGRFAHSESIYSFMVFYPEMHRLKNGHFWSWQIGWALGLLLLNVILQVSLTHIAGGTIVLNFLTYQERLIEEKHNSFLDESYIWGERDPCCRGPWCRSSGLECCKLGEVGIETGPTTPGRGNSTGAFSLGLHTHRLRKSSTRADGDLAPEGLLQAGKDQAQRHTAWQMMHKSNQEGAPSTRSLCQDDGNYLTCAQPSMGLLDRWQELDTNRDGQWSLDEAREDAANVACQLEQGITLDETFLGMARGLQQEVERFSGIWADPLIMPPSIVLRKSIPRFFFEFWRGLNVLCSARDVGRCGQLIEEGIFDGPLELGAKDGSHGGFARARDALDFCQRVLAGPTCEAVHGLTYIMWSNLAFEMCGVGSLSTLGRYENPHQPGDKVDFAHFSYSNIQQFSMANGKMFRFFMCLIIFIWLASLFGEVGAVLQLADFAINFPEGSGHTFQSRHAMEHMKEGLRGLMFLKDVKCLQPTSRKASFMASFNSASDTIIVGITRPHRITLFILVGLRLVLLVYMAFAGTIFLLSTYSYTDLLLNVVALSFVFELPEFLYGVFVIRGAKEQVEGHGPIFYRTCFPKASGINGLLLSKDFWSLLLLPVFIIVIVHWNQVSHTFPIMEALECACKQSGPRCATARAMNREWFSEYWQRMSLG